ncbi:hypothetical protein U879_09470 [Defluviimonas sp. 20V17]|uniref:Uncharacterized protein n=1 Tax=Allgaiera indica TaxID=765699 RepID=A0AAN4ZXZ7_9RHOB|nr:hypothetical protein [Allgaiera indica]KDB03927.1 hypothetical protein U879_09470 [Defluviimonas sp. 20V17]GHD99266.1 hypothetical protein GCM10008024_05960 [Allgaiera indica]SDW30211.1 hypothetical protein SAMN05444006_102279 [Allgaiera indica]
MSLGGPTGAGSLPPLPLPAGSAALRQLAQSGWIDGRVSSMLAEGGARIATALGLVIAAEVAAGLMPGDRVRLRMNPQTGRIEAELLRPGAAPVSAPAPGPGPGAAAPVAPPQPSALVTGAPTPHLPSAALAGLAPILPGGGAPGAAPPPGAPLYGLIAALFPGPAGPSATRATRRGGRKGAAFADTGVTEEETTDDAPPPTQAAEAPRSPRRDPLDLVDWTLASGAEPPAAEVPRTEPPPAEAPRPALTEALAAQFARLSGHLPEAGAIQLDARRLGDHITLEVFSEAPLPAEFARLIRTQAEALARAWDARLSCGFRHGPLPGAGPATA